MMKILVLNYEFPPLGGGAAPVSRDISIQFVKQGHDVTVVTMGYGDLPGYEELQGVKIYRLSCLRTKKSSCKPWEQYTYLMALRRFMKKHMLTHTYDVCHTHFVIPTGEAAKWVKRKYNIPYVITAHGSDVEGHNRKLTMRIMHRILRKSWRKIVDESFIVISPSMYLMDRMKNNYDCGKYIYIPNGIEWNKYHEMSKGENKTKNILIMGRLQKFKNVQTILNALSMVDLKDWTVDILGDGPYREELEQISDRLGLSSKVTFHGWIDNGTSEQLSYIKKACVYITASKFENCPMSVIETVAAGCYPLLSDIPAHRQLIESDEYYFETNNPTELADKIKVAMEKYEFGFGDTIDVSMYDWNDIIKQYEDVLQKGGRLL
jgi:glycosyltransferase involved in cell wall biosynthesis